MQRADSTEPISPSRFHRADFTEPISMTIKIPIHPRTLRSQYKQPCAATPALLAAILLAAAFAPASAQGAATSLLPPSSPSAKASQTGKGKLSTTARKKPSPAVPAPVAAPIATVEAPPAPVLPDWPVNDKPTPAQVTWDSHGLRVEANNASLIQTLHEVALDTGAKIDGIHQDQRVFGVFGPGPAKDVLSQLLDGSGYNMILVGDLGHGTPRQIILSPRTTGAPQSATSSAPASGDAEEPEPQPVPQQPQFQPPMPQPPPQPNPFGGGGTIRTPQEIMLEMQQRMQQMQQQQQQQQPPQ